MSIFSEFELISVIAFAHYVLELIGFEKLFLPVDKDIDILMCSPTEEHGSFISWATPGSLAVVQETP